MTLKNFFFSTTKQILSSIITESTIISEKLPLDLPERLKSKDYQSLRKLNLNGKINNIIHNDIKIELVGTQYEFIPIKNIYKILIQTKPDFVLIQLKPEIILKNFKINPKKNGKFSHLSYFQQLVREPRELMPNLEFYSQIYKNLKSNNIFVNEIKHNNEKFKPFTSLECLNENSLAAISYYCIDKEIPIILSDLPDLVFRQNIVNTHSLLQLQTIFTVCCRNLALYPDLNPQSPIKIGYMLFPEIFLEKTDRYIASLINFMSRKSLKNKKILGFVGLPQSLSIQHYIQQNDMNFEQHLVSKAPEEGFIRELTVEELIEKHSILDVLLYGRKIMKNFDNCEFKISYKIIEEYGDPKKIDSKKNDYLRLLHLEFIKKYQNIAQEEFLKGKKELKREFIKEVQGIK